MSRDQEMCVRIKKLDREYGTDPWSPLHHDNNCPIHSRKARKDTPAMAQHTPDELIAGTLTPIVRPISPTDHPHPKGTPRTARQEFRYGQALAYAWGRQDGASQSTRMPGSIEFATFYGMAETIAHDTSTLQSSFNYFQALRKEEQEAYYDEWQRPPFPGIYAMMNGEHIAQVQE